MLVLIGLLISYIVFCFADHEMDEIQNHPNATELEKLLSKKLWEKIKVWYLENRWQTNSWWIKNVFSFLTDGWHCLKATRNFIAFVWLSILICFLVGISFWWSILFSLLFYILHGVVHSYYDGSLIKED